MAAGGTTTTTTTPGWGPRTPEEEAYLAAQMEMLSLQIGEMQRQSQLFAGLYPQQADLFKQQTQAALDQIGLFHQMVSQQVGVPPGGVEQSGGPPTGPPGPVDPNPWKNVIPGGVGRVGPGGTVIWDPPPRDRTSVGGATTAGPANAPSTLDPQWSAPYVSWLQSQGMDARIHAGNPDLQQQYTTQTGYGATTGDARNASGAVVSLPGATPGAGPSVPPGAGPSVPPWQGGAPPISGGWGGPPMAAGTGGMALPPPGQMPPGPSATDANAFMQRVLSGQSLDPLSEAERQRVAAVYGNAAAEADRQTRQFAEEMAGTRGMRFTDTPIGEPVTRIRADLARAMGAEQAGAELGLGQTQQALRANIAQSQAGLAEQARQYGGTLAEQQRQFGGTFGEGQRQFNVGAGQWGQQFGEGQRQFNVGQGNWQQQFGLNLQQFQQALKQQAYQNRLSLLGQPPTTMQPNFNLMGGGPLATFAGLAPMLDIFGRQRQTGQTQTQEFQPGGFNYLSTIAQAASLPLYTYLNRSTPAPTTPTLGLGGGGGGGGLNLFQIGM